MGTSYDPGRLLPWVPEAFHARFPLSVKAFKKVTRAKHVSAGGRRNGAPRRTWEKTSGTQGRRLSATQPFLVSSHDAPGRDDTKNGLEADYLRYWQNLKKMRDLWVLVIYIGPNTTNVTAKP